MHSVITGWSGTSIHFNAATIELFLETGMKPSRIHVLIVEDDAAHAGAIRRAFETSEPETVVKVVGTLQEFRQCSVDWPRILP